MTLHLDHIVVAVADLDRASEDYRALGFTVNKGGTHANRATHNALVVFEDGTYIELLAPTGEDPLPGLIDFGRMLRPDEGLTGFALRTDDIDAEAARLRAAGFAVGAVVPGSRQKGDRLIEWKLALIDDGFAPFLIQDMTPRAWRVPTDAEVVMHANRALGMPAVVYIIRNMKILRTHFSRLLGVPVREEEQRLGCIVIQPVEDGTGGLAGVELAGEVGDLSMDKTHGVQFFVAGQ